MLFRPRIETLEAREVPASAALDLNGNLVVMANPGNDNVITNSTNPAATQATVNGVLLGTFDLSGVGKRVIVFPLGGNNVVQILGSLPSEVRCPETGFGNNRLIGGSGDDALFGGMGNDTFMGGAGNDLFFGGGGRDYMTGGDGRDVLASGVLFGPAPSYAAVIAARDAWLTSNDVLDLAGLAASYVADGNRCTLSGGAGADAFLRHVADLAVDFNPMIDQTLVT